MELLDSLIASGQIVLVMAAFVGVEIVVLVAYWHRTGRGVAPIALLLNIGAGGSLMLALYTIASGIGTPATALCLLGALVFHVADLAQRWVR